MKTKLYIGLDVHKETIVAATAHASGGDPQLYGTWGGSNISAERGLLRLLKKFGLEKHEVSVVYEAGPSGFVLARRLLHLGYHCIIVSPTGVPDKSGDRVKTDRRDACKLARYHRSGDLDPIHIPDAADEAVRDLCRARTDASVALAKARKQLVMFLLRNGSTYDGKTNWTQAHMNYLRKLRMAHPAQQLVLEEYITAVDSGAERVARVEGQMKDILPSWEREPYVRALMAFRGFQEVAAMTEVSELGDLTRFESPRQLMAYLGLVPSEASSGSKRRQGAITKTGNGHARWMLIECASHYRMPPRVSPQLSARQEGQSREVRAIAWRAQERLNRRFKRLSARGLHRNKVVVAVARELCGYLWELHRQVALEGSGGTTA